MQKINNNQNNNIPAIIFADSLDSELGINNSNIFIPFYNNPLEFLLTYIDKSIINEVHIFTCDNNTNIKSIVDNFNKKKRKIAINILYCSEKCISYGDKIRSLYSMRVINTEFIIIKGNMITNMNINDEIDLYYKIKTANKDLILYKLFSKSNIFTSYNNSILYKKGTNKLLTFDKINNNTNYILKQNEKLSFEDLNDYEIRFDIIDTGISICSFDIFNYYIENFDYHSEQDDLIKDLLSSELHTDSVYFNILNKRYLTINIASIKNLNDLCKNLVRKNFGNYLHNKDNFTIENYNIYKYNNVKIGNNSVLRDFSYIDKDTIINNNCLITKTIINGINTIIEDNVTIFNSQLTNNINLKISKDIKLKNVIIFSCKDYVITEDIENTIIIINNIYSNIINEDIECIDNKTLKLDSDSEDEDLKVDYFVLINESVNKALENETRFEHLGIELSSIRMSENITSIQIVNAVMDIIFDIFLKNENNSIMNNIKSLSKWTKILSRFLISEQDFIDFINKIETFCNKNNDYKIHLFLQLLYQENILEDYHILDWEQRKLEENSEFGNYCLKLMEQFLDYLKEEDDDEEEEED